MSLKMHIAILFSCTFALIAASPNSMANDNHVMQRPHRFSTSNRAAGERLVDVIAKDPELTTLVTALKAANLVDDLKGQGPFTVWAPTNDAFAALPAGTLEHLLEPANVQQLRAVLLYHVCPGRLGIQDLLSGSAKTLDAGESVRIDLGASGFPFQIKVNGISPETGLSTLDASNGYATKLVGVLIPPTSANMALSDLVVV